MKVTNLTPEEQGISQIAANIIEVPAETFLHKNSLPYSWYVARNRALVTVDGLKPVQRRILWSMFKDGYSDKSKYIKAGTAAANTMGKYHPHGNISIEEALGRMAQWFNFRVPLIDPEGSVGYFTGDRASAARYWECRLTPAAMELVKELEHNAIPMGLNFDNSLPEPARLPARWPAVLINGTEGIAVGYASKIFPHNPTEIMDATIALAKNSEATLDDLLEIIKGPDFPTGGEIVGVEGLRECYETGSGSFTVRGRYRVNQLSRGRSQIIFYELPFQVSGEDVISKVQTAKLKAGKFTEISEMKDLSDKTQGLRLAITLKSGANADVVAEQLFKLTPASKPFSLNQTILDNGVPTQMSMMEILTQFIEFRKFCIMNVSEAKLNKFEKEFQNNLGLITVIADIDTTLDLIKNADNSEIARTNLMNHFKITEDQANYVLSLQLRRITRADRASLQLRNDELSEKIAHLNLILTDDEAMANELIEQLEETKKIIGDERRTVINSKTSDEIKEEERNAKLQDAAISKNASYLLTVFADGSVHKSLDLSGAAVSNEKIPYLYKFTSKPDAALYAVLPDGNAVKFPAEYIPYDKRVSSEALGLGEEYVGIGKMTSTRSDIGLLLVTNTGKIALINGKYPTTMDRFPLVALEEGERVVSVNWVTKTRVPANVFLASSEGFGTLFPISTLRASNSGIKPIKGMLLSEDAEIVGVSVVGTKGSLITTTKQTVKVTDLSEIPVRSRGTKGIILQRLGSYAPMTGMFAANEGELSVTDKMGHEMALPPVTGRALTGTKFLTVGLVFGKANLSGNENSNDIDLENSSTEED